MYCVADDCAYCMPSVPSAAISTSGKNVSTLPPGLTWPCCNKAGAVVTLMSYQRTRLYPLPSPTVCEATRCATLPTVRNAEKYIRVPRFELPTICPPGWCGEAVELNEFTGTLENVNVGVAA